MKFRDLAKCFSWNRPDQGHIDGDISRLVLEVPPAPDAAAPAPPAPALLPPPLPPLLPMSLLRTLLANAPDTNAPAPTADAPAPRSCSRGIQEHGGKGFHPLSPERKRRTTSDHHQPPTTGFTASVRFLFLVPPDFPRQGGLPSSSPAAFDMPPFRLPPMRSLLRSLLPFRFPAARATPGPRRSLLIFEHMSDAARALVLGEGSEGGEVAGIDRAVVRLPACGSTPAIVTMPVDADTHLSALLAHPTPAELTTTVEEAEMAEVTPGRSTIAANLPVPHRQPAQDGGADVPTTEDERRLVADWAAARIALLHSVIVGPAPGPGPAFAPRLRAPSPPQPVAARGASSGGR
ncbi:hypothetical protein B0H10DRAFT_2438013 [Mycena sp. CBHHK59/15]|nr:hypothetical protein B0H10DRAFT_2438013 [Mycena sp. CBHHK59/15]